MEIINIAAVIAAWVVGIVLAVILSLLATKLLLIIRDKLAARSIDNDVYNSSDYCNDSSRDDSGYYLETAVAASVSYVLVTLIKLIF